MKSKLIAILFNLFVVMSLQLGTASKLCAAMCQESFNSVTSFIDQIAQDSDQKNKATRRRVN